VPRSRSTTCSCLAARTANTSYMLLDSTRCKCALQLVSFQLRIQRHCTRSSQIESVNRLLSLQARAVLDARCSPHLGNILRTSTPRGAGLTQLSHAVAAARPRHSSGASEYGACADEDQSRWKPVWPRLICWRLRPLLLQLALASGGLQGLGTRWRVVLLPSMRLAACKPARAPLCCLQC
jgi:hypothetical protein